MFACVSPHFHKDVILREREFDLEYLAFFRDVYLIQDTELTFPPFSTHYLHYRFLRRIMWHALLWKKSDWGKAVEVLECRVGPSQKENIFSFSNWQRKTVPPHCFPEKYISRLSYRSHLFDGNLECFY